MVLNKKLFAELEGFVIYEPYLTNKYIVKQNIGSDLLSSLTTSENGDIVTREGLIIPIIGVPADYYIFNILEEEPENYLKKSTGWILNIESGEFNIIGIGYLFDITKIEESNYLTFSISKGWYELSIISYINSTNDNCFGLILKKVLDKPIYNGDLNTDYFFR